MSEQKPLEYYLSLPYTMEVIQEDEGTWFARVTELPGCITEGDSPEEAVKMLRDAMVAWLETAIDDEAPIPEPHAPNAYSGRFVVRVPRSLHQDLVRAAEREGVSLNQYINVTLARSVGQTVLPA
jgi:antitoxin HicB